MSTLTTRARAIILFALAALAACESGGTKSGAPPDGDAAFEAGAELPVDQLGGTGGSGTGGTSTGTGGAGGAAGADVAADLRPDVGAEVATEVMADTAVDTRPDVGADSADAAPDAVEAGAPDAVAMCGRLLCDCTLRGKRLYGPVRFVTAPPFDFKVDVVTSHLTDLYVKKVKPPVLADRCGVWLEESLDPTPLRILVVTDNTQDFSIQYDELLPGLPGRRGQ